MNKINVFVYITDDEQKTVDFMRRKFGIFKKEISMGDYQAIKKLAKFALWENEPTKHNNQIKGELFNE